MDIWGWALKVEEYKHAEYIMTNAGLDEAQAGIKIAGKNTNNLRYADDDELSNLYVWPTLYSMFMKIKKFFEKRNIEKMWENN